MIYQNAGSDSDVESESNFHQPNGDKGKMSSKNNNFVRNNCMRIGNNQQLPPPRNMLSATSGFQRRRASDCSSYNIGDGGCNNINYYGPPSISMRRGSRNEATIEQRRNSHNNKSSLSSSSDDVSSGSHSTCSISDDSSSTSSGQPNLPYPGFVEFSFKYLSQDTRLRNWCLQLITNP